MDWVASEAGLEGRGRWFFRRVTADASAGEVVTLISRPDPDRTLLTLALSGRIRLSEGGVLFDSEVLTRHRAPRLSAIGWLPGMRLFEDRAQCAEIVGQAYAASRVSRHVRDIPALLMTAGLTKEARTAASDLRDGAKAALGVAVLRALRPRVAFVDVPPMPEAARTGIVASVEALRASGTAIVIVHHEAWPGADRSVELIDAPGATT